MAVSKKKQVKKKIVKGLLQNNFTITDKRYVEFENDTGYHHYNIDVAKYYEMEEHICPASTANTSQCS